MTLAIRVATAIINGFESAIEDHNSITLGARARFENNDWPTVQLAQKQRIDAYKNGIKRAASRLEGLAGEQLHCPEFWAEVKTEYAEMVEEHDNPNITQTFYNSVFSHWVSYEEYDERILFVEGEKERDYEVSPRVFNRFRYKTNTREIITRILERYQFKVKWRDTNLDINNVLQRFEEQVIPDLCGPIEQIEIQILKSVFYRNKGAYLVGRIIDQDEIKPFILPIVNETDYGLRVDALITSRDECSIIFSFTRSHFMVDARIPRAYVNFLHTMMPHKQRSELYTSIGFIKHGKTEFVRSYHRFTQRNPDEKIVMAPGIKGMVMSVFTMPGYDVVFKVIKDRFTPPKNMTREEVKSKYKLVTRHDRVGRMADTQEFMHFWFDRSRFDPACLEELLAVAASQVEIIDDRVVIKHLYTERKMVPLNMYLHKANDEQVAAAMDEYGRAIKQIAAANIFPGDMLLKNFGVTRHGRVVFYDYDEICFLTECNFRKIPEPRNEMDEMSSQPWYSVADEDVFPEEFNYFFSGNPKARRAFVTKHADLFEASYWQGIQKDIINGTATDVFPYNDEYRFAI